MGDFDYDSDELTPRLARSKSVVYGYTGPRNDQGQPDTTGSDQMGVMIHPADHPYYTQYSGQWKNGKFTGHGTIVYSGQHKGEKYTGQFQNDVQHGRGVYTFPDGQVLDGIFENNKIVSGKHICSVYTFYGRFENGLMHTGKLVYSDYEFIGRITPDKRIGTQIYADGDVFTGTFTLNPATGVWELNGDGNMIINSTSPKFKYKGQFKNNVRHGNGIIIVGDQMYSAEFDNDKLIVGSRSKLESNGGRRCSGRRKRSGRNKKSKNGTSKCNGKTKTRKEKKC